MIQRIQSIYLLLTTIVMGLMFLMPVATYSDPNCEFYTTKVLMENGGERVLINWYSLILNVTIVAVAFVSIFLYKKLYLQIRLCIVNIVLMIGMLVLLWIETNNIVMERQWHVAVCFPIVGIILTWLATRGIFKDIITIRSLNRIR